MKIYTFLSVVCILLCLYFMPHAQPESLHIPEVGMADFEIQISATQDGYQMKCHNGCHWNDLSYGSWYTLFGKTTYGSSIVDISGVSGCESDLVINRKSDVRYDSSDFAFVVHRTESGFELERIKGTAWQSLKFDCMDSKCVAVINAKGLVSQK